MTHLLSRRSVLRGTGTAMALPFLEAMLPRGSIKRPPARLVYVYAPNGMELDSWWPKKEGPLGKLPKTLRSLQPFRDELSIYGGLTSDKARANGDGPGDHARAAASWLTGVQPKKANGGIGLGVSADQIAAEQLGKQTRFRSLQLGCERGGNAGQCDSGYSCAYSSNISWQGESTPASKEVNPRLVFDRLFRGGTHALAREASAERVAERKSILDYLKEDKEHLWKSLGAADREKLSEYFAGVREMERRIDLFEKSHVASVADSDRPSSVTPDYAAHLKVMADLLALAFQADVTRVATFMMANEGSNRSYPNLGIKGGHHSISHHGDVVEKRNQIQAINQFHVEHLAYLLGKFHEIKEGQGNLLENTMLVFGSNIGDGNRHNHEDLPTLVCGGGSGKLEQGVFKRFPKETPLANLHLSLLGKMGVSVSTLGDSTGVLPI